MAEAAAGPKAMGLLPVSVVEDHDEALHVIYRAIGSKRLPLAGNTLVHFDAHPDLLSPDLPADDFADKEKLFAHTSIAEWILPAVYMGHVDCVVWLKPPWSRQSCDGQYRLVVGREEKSGFVRVGTPLAYFISGQLFAHSDTLTNLRTIPLHVLTLPVLKEPPNLSPSHTPSSPSHPLPPLLATAECELTGLLSSGSQSWILDVDLDFFSTANPFRDDFSQEEYSLLESLYRYDEPLDHSRERVDESVRKREEQLESLKRLWMAGNEGAGLTELHLTHSDRRLVSDLRRKIGTVCSGLPIKAEDIHEAGMMSDLPHHPAGQSEWAGLMSATSRLLETVFSTCGPPALVTVARSSDDGYTPPDVVGHLQEQLVGVVNSLHNEHTHVQHHYLCGGVAASDRQT